MACEGGKDLAAFSRRLVPNPEVGCKADTLQSPPGPKDLGERVCEALQLLGCWKPCFGISHFTESAGGSRVRQRFLQPVLRSRKPWATNQTLGGVGRWVGG